MSAEQAAQAIHEAHTTMTYSLRDIANGDTGTLDPRDCPVCAPIPPDGGGSVKQYLRSRVTPATIPPFERAQRIRDAVIDTLHTDSDSELHDPWA